MKTGKKVVALFAAFVMFLQLAAGIIPATVYAQTDDNKLYGDVDGNGVVNTADCDALRAVLSGEKECTALADVDLNNIVEQYDLTTLSAICEDENLIDGDLLDFVEQQELMQCQFAIGDSHRALHYRAVASDTKVLTLQFTQMQNWAQSKGVYYDILAFVTDGDRTGYTLQLTDNTGAVSNALSLNLTSGWTRISFPLSQIRNVDLQAVTGIIFSFSAQTELNLFLDRLQISDEVFPPAPEEKYIIENGTSQYKILIPENSSSYEQKASQHLQEFIRKATGVTMEITTQVVLNEKYISLGNTSLLTENISDVNVSDLGARGFKVQTVDDHIFIYAKSDFGVYIGASCLLYETVDYACYGVDAYNYSQKSSVKLQQFDITEIPDIEYNIAMSGYLSDEATCNNLGYNTRDIFWGGNNNGIHSSFDIVPKSEYGTSHPSFYSRYSKTQLCYTAQGNAAEYEALLNVFANYIQDLLTQNTGNKPIIVGVTVQDNDDYCYCNTCWNVKTQYGSYSATVIRFCNDLAEKMYAWFETEAGSAYKCELDIMFLAYHAYEDAPAKWNATTGTYEPIDDTVVANEHVIPMLAPINAKHSYPLNSDENQQVRENIKKWSAISDKTMLWGYSTTFHNYFIPFNWMNSVDETIKYVEQQGYEGLLIQQEYNNVSGGFNALQDYMVAKLSWDATLDQNQIIDEFFAGYYGPAEDDMLEMFNTLCAVFDYQQNTLGKEDDIWADTPTAQCWPKDKLLAMLDYGEQAIGSLEELKTSDPQMYDVYVKRVKMEMIDIRYLLIELYGEDYAADLLTMKTAFRTECEYLGIRHSKELADASELFALWSLTDYPILAHDTDIGSVYEKDDEAIWFNHTILSNSEWTTRVEFGTRNNMKNTFGGVYTSLDVIIRLQDGYNGTLMAMINSDYYMLNNANIQVYDAVSNTPVAVSASGALPTERWLRIVINVAEILDVDAITAQNCYRIALTHKECNGTNVMNVARVLAIDPDTYIPSTLEGITQPTSWDLTSILGKTGTRDDGSYYSTYKKDEVFGWYNHTTDGGSANEWNNRLELANTAHTYALGSIYTTAEFVVYLEHNNNFQMKVVAGSNNPYHALNSAGITVYDAITGEVISVGADGKVPTERWLRIVADLKVLLGVDTVTEANCYRIGLTHTAGVGSASIRLARALVVNPATYIYEVPAVLQISAVDITSVLGNTGTKTDGSYYSTYQKNEAAGWYSHTTDGSSATEWNNRLELANTAQTYALGSKYTNAEFVVYLERTNSFQLKVVAGSNNPYHALNSAGIKVYDAITGEVISVGTDGKVPTQRWLRIVADLKVLVGADTITTSNCYRIGLTHTAGVGSASMRVARAMVVDPAKYSYEKPDFVVDDVIRHLDFTSVLGKTDTASSYAFDETKGYYNYIATSGTEWTTRIDFLGSTQTAQMGDQYPQVEFVVQLPADYAATLQVMVNSSYKNLNDGNIKVYDAVTNEQIAVGSNGKVPTGKWLRIVADVKSILGAPVTAQNCWRVALTHKGNSTTTVTKVAHVLAIDPTTYVYETPDCVIADIVRFLDFTSVYAKTDAASSYALDAETGCYNYTATSGTEWTTRIDFLGSTQTAQMGDQYPQVEFVVQLPADYAAKLQVMVNSSYKYLNDGNIKVYDAITNEQIIVGSDGSVPTGKWLRIVADIKSMVGAPVTAQNCWRVALTHKGNSITSVTKVARVLAIYPELYVYELPEVCE